MSTPLEASGGPGSRPALDLTLVVNPACNLRCTYCYTGPKVNRPMTVDRGHRAIRWAADQIAPGGLLNLGFFGGEPLLMAHELLDWSHAARNAMAARGGRCRILFTTNGTITGPAAWLLMADPAVDLTVSCDGLPAVHDRHRRSLGGAGSAGIVATTLRRLVEQGRDFRVNMVVRPDTHAEAPAGVDYIHSLGVRHVELSLDWWAHWTREDAEALGPTVEQLARLWVRRRPDLVINWIETAVAVRLDPSILERLRCACGTESFVVAPSGRFYACERLVGGDEPANSAALPWTLEHPPVLAPGHAPVPALPATCAACPALETCTHRSPCSNHARTGDPGRPDGLMCALERHLGHALSILAAEHAGPPPAPLPIHETLLA